MTKEDIPAIIVARLPLYLETLEIMHNEGIHKTSSRELGDRIGITAAQIRKDLSQFGEFGKQGTGYSIPGLVNELRSILNVNRIWEVALIGAGSLGTAIARYPEFLHRGFKITMIFDTNPQLIGSQIGDLTIEDSVFMVERIRKSNIKIALLTVPGPIAQSVADDLVTAGVTAILNYAPVALNMPPDIIHVQHIDPILQLQQMTYYLDES